LREEDYIASTVGFPPTKGSALFEIERIK